MEEQLQYPLAVTHLLQHTLRSLCIHDNSQWIYAVFWRILPRNYPPPKWDLPGSFYDRSRGNRRNWILVWEDGFCNFAASCEAQDFRGLQPELFFKMSHEIYNYGEGLIGKVASDHSHKWVTKDKEPQDQEINFLSSWHNPADSVSRLHPRTWEAQFQSGIKTIALIAVREGVVQLGAINKVAEDLSYVVLLRKKFSYLESIPGVLLPHPSSSAFPFKLDVGCNNMPGGAVDSWACHTTQTQPVEAYNHFSQQMRITPSMSSLEALLSKLPAVGPATPSASSSGLIYESSRRPSPEMMGVDKLVVAKEEMEEEDHEYGHHQHQHDQRGMGLGGESSSSIIPQVYNYVKPNEGF